MLKLSEEHKIVDRMIESYGSWFDFKFCKICTDSLDILFVLLHL